MFTLADKVASNSATHLDDSAKIKFALTALDYYDDAITGLTPYTEKALFNSIKKFQQENGLAVDGIINSEGPTHNQLKYALQKNKSSGNAFSDFYKNYGDMKEANTVNADKYFHCKANYEAAQRGWLGKQSAETLSNVREVYGGLKGDTVEDSVADQKANIYGRNAATSNKYSSSSEACAIYRPRGLDEKY